MKKLFLFLLIFCGNVLKADLSVLLDAIASQDVNKVQLELSSNQQISESDKKKLVYAAFNATEKLRYNLPIKDHLKIVGGYVCCNIGGILGIVSVAMLGLSIYGKNAKSALGCLIPAAGSAALLAIGYDLLVKGSVLYNKAKDIERLMLNIQPVK